MCPTENLKLLNPSKFGSVVFLSVGRNGILALAIMKKLENGHLMINMSYGKNLKLLTSQSLGLWFPSIDVNAVLVSAITKKSKIGHYFINMDGTEKFQITVQTPQSLGL